MSNRKESRRTKENPLAVPVLEAFAVEVTTTVGRCRSCGTSSESHVRVCGPDPRFVGRYPHCGDVLLRLVRTPDPVWVDFGGGVRAADPHVNRLCCGHGPRSRLVGFPHCA